MATSPDGRAAHVERAQELLAEAEAAYRQISAREPEHLAVAAAALACAHLAMAEAPHVVGVIHGRQASA